MSKRVFIVHGWDGYPEVGWFPWLKQELEKRDFDVFVPQMPDPETPRIQTWVLKLNEVVGNVDSNTYFVGHSMGCQTIVRYLASLPNKSQVGGAVFVAGFFKQLTNLEDDPEVHEIAAEWLETPLDLSKAKDHLPRSIAIFSDNDPFVPLDNQDDFAEKLGSEIIIEKNKEHFNESAGILELPMALEALLKIANQET